MGSVVLKWALAILIVGGLIAFLMYLHSLYREWLFGPLHEGLEGFKPSETKPGELVGEWEGHDVRIRYNIGGRYQRDSLSVHLDCSGTSLPKVQFKREGWWHLFNKWIGLSDELRTGDYEFDEDVYVVTDTPDAVKNWLGSRDLRSSVEFLLDPKRASLSVSPNEIHYEIKSSWGWKSYFQPDRVREFLSTLVGLEEHEQATCPQTSESADPKSEHERMLKTGSTPVKAILFSGLASMFVGPPLWFMGTYYPPVTWTLHGWALKVTGITMAIYLIVAFFHVRGHSQSHREFTTFLVCGAIGIPTLILGGFQVINGALYPGNTEWIPGTIQEIRRDDDGGYDVEIAPDDPRYDSTLDRSFYGPEKRLRHARRVRVLVSSGRLGVPWVKDWKLKDGRSPK